MKWRSMAVNQLDWREPWGWPRKLQDGLFMGAGVLGMLLLSPWWLQSWQAWDEANAAQAKLQAQQAATQALREQTVQLLQTHNQPLPALADPDVLTQLAQQQGLQLSQLGLEKPQQSPALKALHMEHLPVHLKVQGSGMAGSIGWRNGLMLRLALP